MLSLFFTVANTVFQMISVYQCKWTTLANLILYFFESKYIKESFQMDLLKHINIMGFLGLIMIFELYTMTMAV